jgi:hypothetical protein
MNPPAIIDIKPYSFQSELKLLMEVKNVLEDKNYANSFFKRREKEKYQTVLIYEIDSRSLSSNYRELTLRALLNEVLNETSPSQLPQK